jgi:hypothetical protein
MTLHLIICDVRWIDWGDPMTQLRIVNDMKDATFWLFSTGSNPFVFGISLHAFENGQISWLYSLVLSYFHNTVPRMGSIQSSPIRMFVFFPDSDRMNRRQPRFKFFAEMLTVYFNRISSNFLYRWTLMTQINRLWLFEWWVGCEATACLRRHDHDSFARRGWTTPWQRNLP